MVTYDNTGGKFGAFAVRCLSPTSQFSTVMRVTLEKINGRYQGACYNFRAGFGSGNVPIELTPKDQCSSAGPIAAGGSRGQKPFAVERMDWSARSRSRSMR